MTQRINTDVAEFTSETFTPAGDFSIQADIPAPSKAVIEIEGRVDDAAPWVLLGQLTAFSYPPMQRFAKCPNVRLRLRSNDGKAVKVWSGE